MSTTSTAAGRRRWQFSIRGLMLVMLAVAAAFSWWQGLRHSAERKQLRIESERFERKLFGHEELWELLPRLDSERDSHREVIRAIASCDAHPNVARLRYPVVTESGPREVVQLTVKEFAYSPTKWDILLLYDREKLLEFCSPITNPHDLCQEIVVDSGRVDQHPRVLVADHCWRHSFELGRELSDKLRPRRLRTDDEELEAKSKYAAKHPFSAAYDITPDSFQLVPSQTSR